MNKLFSLILLAAVLVTGAGCRSMFHGKACLKPGGYVDARNDKPLTVPAGLDAPDTRGALRIPDSAAPAHVRTSEEGCLDTPPRFAEPKASKPAA